MVYFSLYCAYVSLARCANCYFSTMTCGRSVFVNIYIYFLLNYWICDNIQKLYLSSYSTFIRKIVIASNRVTLINFAGKIFFVNL